MVARKQQKKHSRSVNFADLSKAKSYRVPASTSQQQPSRKTLEMMRRSFMNRSQVAIQRAHHDSFYRSAPRGSMFRSSLYSSLYQTPQKPGAGNRPPNFRSGTTDSIPSSVGTAFSTPRELGQLPGPKAAPHIAKLVERFSRDNNTDASFSTPNRTPDPRLVPMAPEKHSNSKTISSQSPTSPFFNPASSSTPQHSGAYGNPRASLRTPSPLGVSSQASSGTRNNFYDYQTTPVNNFADISRAPGAPSKHSRRSSSVDPVLNHSFADFQRPRTPKQSFTPQAAPYAPYRNTRRTSGQRIARSNTFDDVEAATGHFTPRLPSNNRPKTPPVPTKSRNPSFKTETNNVPRRLFEDGTPYENFLTPSSSFGNDRNAFDGINFDMPTMDEDFLLNSATGGEDVTGFVPSVLPPYEPMSRPSSLDGSNAWIDRFNEQMRLEEQSRNEAGPSRLRATSRDSSPSPRRSPRDPNRPRMLSSGVHNQASPNSRQQRAKPMFYVGSSSGESNLGVSRERSNSRPIFAVGSSPEESGEFAIPSSRQSPVSFFIGRQNLSGRFGRSETREEPYTPVSFYIGRQNLTGRFSERPEQYGTSSSSLASSIYGAAPAVSPQRQQQSRPRAQTLPSGKHAAPSTRHRFDSSRNHI